MELAADDASKATVDIEVRDAVTHKRVRRDVDLSRIPDDGRAAAIAIESDELLRASWAEVALDTARARQAQKPAAAGGGQRGAGDWRRAGGEGGGLGARAAVEHFFGGTTLVGADGVGRLRLSPRIALEIAGALRFGPSVAAPHGQVSALAAGGSLALLVRIAGGGRRASLAAGAGVSAGWLEFRAEPRPAPREPRTATCWRWRACGWPAGWRSGARLHGTAGLDGGVALRGVEATDAGAVVARARGAALGATLGLEAP